MTNRTKGIFALFLLSVIWGSFGLPIRYLGLYFPFFQQIYLRILPAAIFCLLIFNKDIHLKKFISMPKKDLFILIFRCFILYGFAVTLYTKAYFLTTFSEVSFLGAIPTTAILGFILVREKITFQKILFIGLSVIGIFLITVKNPSHFFTWTQGDIIALIADFFFSLNYVTRKWQSDFLSNKEISAFMLLFGFLFLFTLSLIKGEGLPNPYSFSLATSAVIIGVGILNAGSIFFTNYGFAYVEAALASNIVSLECFFAVILGFIFYKEIPTIATFVGGILILASVAFLNKEEEKK